MFLIFWLLVAFIFVIPSNSNPSISFHNAKQKTFPSGPDRVHNTCPFSRDSRIIPYFHSGSQQILNILITFCLETCKFTIILIKKNLPKFFDVIYLSFLFKLFVHHPQPFPIINWMWTSKAWWAKNHNFSSSLKTQVIQQRSPCYTLQYVPYTGSASSHNKSKWNKCGVAAQQKQAKWTNKKCCNSLLPFTQKKMDFIPSNRKKSA